MRAQGPWPSLGGFWAPKRAPKGTVFVKALTGAKISCRTKTTFSELHDTLCLQWISQIWGGLGTLRLFRGPQAQNVPSQAWDGPSQVWDGPSCFWDGPSHAWNDSLRPELALLRNEKGHFRHDIHGRGRGVRVRTCGCSVVETIMFQGQVFECSYQLEW